MSVFLDALQIHDSWSDFFSQSEVQTELVSIENTIGTLYTPQTNHVLRFAITDLQEVSCVILGKDPYPQPNVATGRAFEVSGVTSWFDREVNSSLKNMLKLIHKSHFDREIGAGIEEVRQDIEHRVFQIPPPNEAFGYWEGQGALFLNTAFTCEVGGFEKAGSHLQIWKPFFMRLLKYMTEKNGEIRYFLWGDAKKYAKMLKQLGVPDGQLYTSRHPCTNGDDGGYQDGSRFLNCPCFIDTKSMIHWVIYS